MDEFRNSYMLGRRKIYTSALEINEENVIDQVNQAFCEHRRNVWEIDYLYWYRRGYQPILQREKEIRPEICNKVVVNNANQIVVFKNGYFLTKPAFYRPRNDEAIEKVNELNNYLYSSGKQNVDNEVVNWLHTVGIGALLIEPNREGNPKKPVNVFTLDPRCAFVVYSRRPGNEPMFAVNMVVVDKQVYFDVFTKDYVYRLKGGKVVDNREMSFTAMAIVYPVTETGEKYIERNAIGEIPIVEYTYNENRMGAFENALPIMDAINLIESNRLDGIEQFIQSLVVTTNVQLDEGITANTIRQAGMINLTSIGENKADFKVLSEQLDQQQTQVTLDNLYQQLLDKTGLPSTMHTGSQSNDSYGAVYLRSGWAVADTDCRNCEDLFVKSNKLFDKVFLEILRKTVGFELDLDDFELHFPRNDTNNLVTKTQVALNMKNLGFSPEIAFERSGLSNNPLEDIAKSKEYIEKMWNQTEEEKTEDDFTKDLNNQPKINDI